MEIIVLSFGQIADITGKSNLKLTGINTTEELFNKLPELFPELLSWKYSIAVNHKIVLTNTSLNEGDVVALLPPFSGG